MPLFYVAPVLSQTGTAADATACRSADRRTLRSAPPRADTARGRNVRLTAFGPVACKGRRAAGWARLSTPPEGACCRAAGRAADLRLTCRLTCRLADHGRGVRVVPASSDVVSAERCGVVLPRVGCSFEAGQQMLLPRAGGFIW